MAYFEGKLAVFHGIIVATLLSVSVSIKVQIMFSTTSKGAKTLWKQSKGQGFIFMVQRSCKESDHLENSKIS